MKEDCSLTDRVNIYSNFLGNIGYFSEFSERDSILVRTIELSNQEVTTYFRVFFIQSMNTTNFNLIGIIIGVLAILGFALNRKDKFTQMAFVWCVFSFILLLVLGWGIDENGLLLYTFYFAWAFICLIVKGIEKLLKKYTKLKYIVYSLIIFSMLLINSYGIYKTILFGLKYFKY